MSGQAKGGAASRTGRRSAGGMLAILLLVIYWFAQPVLNERFGLNLPGLNSDNNAQPANNAPTAEKAQPRVEPRVEPAAKQTDVQRSDDGDLKYGLLQEVGRDRYLSPAGLMYTPGSQEGHRLKHIEKHLTDIPSRPGSHGVFDGEMPSVLKLIDQAFEKTKTNDRDVSSSDEDGRMVYEINMRSRIGYVGGQTGSRRQKPAANKLRLVIDGNRVITAFPYD